MSNPEKTSRYDRFVALTRTKSALFALSFVSFANSSFFPVPQDALLLPMMAAKPDRAFFYASICTIASTLGGLFGYGIGYLLFDTLGLYILSLYEAQNSTAQLKNFYDQYGFFLIIFGAITPIPYKVITIGSGLIGYNIFLFFISSLIGRAIRFYGYWIVFHFFGEKIQLLTQRWFNGLALVFTACLVILIVYAFGRLQI